MIGFDPGLVTDIAHHLGWAIFHSLWQGALVAGLLALVLWIIPRRMASARYVAGCFALLTVFTLFVVSCWWAPTATSETAVSAGASLPVAAETILTGTPMDVSEVSTSIVITPGKIPSDKMTAASGKPAGIDWSNISASLATWGVRLEWLQVWLAPLWLFGVLGLSLWRLGGWIATIRLRTLGTSLAPRQVVTELHALAGRLGVTRPVRVLQSALVRTPLMIGFFRPVILLPVAVVTGLTPQQLDAILAHELAHVRRHDYLVNLVQTVIETLLFHHPAVWWISHCIRAEREYCCDDLALSVTRQRLRYAQALAAVAELHAGPKGLAVAASGGSLLGRIQRIADVGLAGEERRGTCAALITLLLVVAVGLASAGLTRSGQASPPRIEQAAAGLYRFGPVIERTIADPRSAGPRRTLPCLIDLDTGRVIAWPADGLPPFNSERGYTEAFKKFMATNGLDAIARWAKSDTDIDGLVGFGMTVVPVKNDQWDIDPRPLAERLANAEPREEQAIRWAKHPPGGGELPRTTYLFRTREGRTGVLQITLVTSSTKVRYKLLQTPGEMAAWSDPVDGPRTRLRPTQRQWKPGATPTLALDLWNESDQDNAFFYISAQQVECEIEVDGQWYRWADTVVLDHPSQSLKAGQARDEAVKISLTRSWARTDKAMQGRPVNEALRLNLAPGKHTIRVAFQPDGPHSDQPRVVSKPVDIEIIAAENTILYDAALATLPSEQGFTLYSDPGHPAYKIVGNVLHQSTTESSGEQWWFCNTTPLDFSANATGIAVEWIVRVKSSGSYGSPPKIDSRGGFGVSIADQAGRWFIIHHRKDAVFIQNQDAEGGFSDLFRLDTTNKFHRYRFIVSKGTGKLFIDGSKRAAITIGLGPTTKEAPGPIPEITSDITKGTGSSTSQDTSERERGPGQAEHIGKGKEIQEFHQGRGRGLKTGLDRGPASQLVRNRNLARFGDLTDYVGSETLLKSFFVSATPDSVRLQPGQSERRKLKAGHREKARAGRDATPKEKKVQNKNIVWGKIVNGLQAGLAAVDPPRPYQIGHNVPLLFFLRNTTDKPITLTHARVPVFINWDNYRRPPGPQLFGPDGKQVFPAPGVGGRGLPGTATRTIAPGEIVMMTTSKLPLRPGNWEGTTVNLLTYRVKPGKHRVSLSHEFNDQDGKQWGGTVTTGMLELHVHATEKPLSIPGSAWGKYQEGVRCRLHTDKARLRSDDPPILLVDLQNQGQRTIEQIWHGLEYKLEVDGKWTGKFSPTRVSGPVAYLTPGQEWINVPLALQDSQYYRAATSSAPGGPATFSQLLGPGRHTIRVDIDGVISNPVEIEIIAAENTDTPQPDTEGKKVSAKRAAAPSKTTVRGKVVDDATGKPVVHFFTQGGKFDPADPAKIAWGYSKTRSRGKDGKFSATVRWPEGWTSRIVAVGYLPQPVLTRPPSPGQDVIEVVIRLKRGDTIRGRVLDHSGHSVVKAGVYLAGRGVIRLAEGPRYERHQQATVLTDAEGRFEISGRGKDSKVIFVTAPPLFVWRADLPELGQEVIIRLPEPAKLHIRYDIEGGPRAAQVRIELRTWDMPKWKALVQMVRWVHVKAGEDGLVVDNLPPGVYDISRIKHTRAGNTVKDLMLDRQLKLTLASGKTAAFNLVRKTGTPISGDVAGLPKEGVDGVFVYVRDQRVSGDPRKRDEWKLRTFDGLALQGNGPFKTERIPPGKYKIIAHAYQVQTPEEMRRTGWRIPFYTGMAVVTVPESGQSPKVHIEMKPPLPPPKTASQDSANTTVR